MHSFVFRHDFKGFFFQAVKCYVHNGRCKEHFLLVTRLRITRRGGFALSRLILTWRAREMGLLSVEFGESSAVAARQAISWGPAARVRMRRGSPNCPCSQKQRRQRLEQPLRKCATFQPQMEKTRVEMCYLARRKTETLSFARKQ